MLALRNCSILALACLTACVGVVEPEAGFSRGSEEDAGRTSSRDGGRPGVSPELEPDEYGSDVGDDDGRDGEGDAQDEDDGSLAPSANQGGCRELSAFPLAQGLHIREVALYQTVKVPLVTDGRWVTQRVAPVVQGKKALVRVFVDPLDGYRAHAVRAVLKLTNGARSKELEDQRTITTPSSDAQLASTFSFEVEPADIAGATQLSVSLVETNCGAESGAAADARFPATGSQALEAEAIDKLKVVVVPVDIDGRLPLTSDSELAKMRATLLAYYPVPDVEITVRAPLDWPDGLAALDGSSWSDLLNQIMRERRSDGPSSNTYYFGLVQPAETFREYCGGGCVLGLAPQTTSVQASAQVALGASFGDAQTYDTMVHELGHAHGRGHAPCVESGEIDGVDSQYPDRAGATSSWGWDSRTDTLKAPTDKDIMGYCEPVWIGAYNYAGLAARSTQVNLKSLRIAGSQSWHNVLLYEDGRARWGGDVERELPGGEPAWADVLDARGAVIDRVEVVRVQLSHAGTQFLYVPEPGAQWMTLRLTDRQLDLAAILPPR